MTLSAVCATTLCFSRSRYTGKERDAESGNDYFGARYYASAMGRFMSADWAAKAEPVPYAKLDDPQSLNLYAYVRNNLLIRVDADGHCDWCDKFWNAGKAVLNSVYLKSEAGLGLKAQVKLGPVKGEVGAKSVREVNATIINQHHTTRRIHHGWQETNTPPPRPMRSSRPQPNRAKAANDG